MHDTGKVFPNAKTTQANKVGCHMCAYRKGYVFPFSMFFRKMPSIGLGNRAQVGFNLTEEGNRIFPQPVEPALPRYPSRDS